MTGAEWMSIVKILKGNYRYNTFLADKETADTWFNLLNRFTYAEVKEGVTDWISEKRDPPVIADLVNCASAARRAQELKEIAEKSEELPDTVKCKYCQDIGFRLKTYPNGSDVLDVCTCQKARSMFPWHFMNHTEYAEHIAEEQKKGRRPSAYIFRAEPEWRRAYLSGDRFLPEAERAAEKENTDRVKKLTAHIGGTL